MACNTIIQCILTINCISVLKLAAQSSPHFQLFQTDYAMIKGRKMDWSVQRSCDTEIFGPTRRRVHAAFRNALLRPRSVRLGKLLESSLPGKDVAIAATVSHWSAVEHREENKCSRLNRGRKDVQNRRKSRLKYSFVEFI